MGGVPAGVRTLVGVPLQRVFAAPPPTCATLACRGMARLRAPYGEASRPFPTNARGSRILSSERAPTLRQIPSMSSGHRKGARSLALGHAPTFPAPPLAMDHRARRGPLVGRAAWPVHCSKVVFGSERHCLALPAYERGLVPRLRRRLTSEPSRHHTCSPNKWSSGEDYFCTSSHFLAVWRNSLACSILSEALSSSITHSVS